MWKADYSMMALCVPEKTSWCYSSFLSLREHSSCFMLYSHPCIPLKKRFHLMEFPVKPCALLNTHMSFFAENVSASKVNAFHAFGDE